MGRPMKITEEQKEIIMNLYNQGYGSTTIAKMLGLKTHQITFFISKYIGMRSCSEAARKYVYNEHYFDEIDTPEKAYWLGFIYADGYVATAGGKTRFGIALSIKDKEHLEKFKNQLNATYPIHEYRPSSTNYSKNDYCRIQIFGKEIYNNMIKHGVVENKTKIITPPKLSQSLTKHFIRGYFDGDGCIAVSNRKNGRVEYAIKIVGTDELLLWIKDFIQKDNIATIKKFYKRRPTDEVSQLEFSGNNQVKNFLDILYKDSTVCLDRKHQRYLELCNLLHSRVTSKDVA